MEDDSLEGRFRIAAQLVAQGRLDDGLERASQLLTAARRESNMMLAAACMSIIGDVHRAKGNYQAAKACTTEGLGESRKAGAHPWVLAIFSVSLGEIARLEGDFPESDRRYSEALQLIGDSSDHPNYLIVLERLAESHFRRGDKGPAYRLQRKALEIREKNGDIAEFLGGLRNLGLCERAEGRTVSQR